MNHFESPPSIVALCEEYYLDRENPQSEQILMELVRKCIKDANNGDYAAQFLLGIMYGSGIIMERDLRKSFEWYEKSAHQGYIEAQAQVLNCYEIGEGVEKNRFMYLYWKEKIANKFHRYERFHSFDQSCSLDLCNDLENCEFILKGSGKCLFSTEEILKRCPFFSNYLKKEWKPSVIENGRFIIDVVPIEDCFPFDFIQTLEMYLTFLKVSENSQQVCKLICQEYEMWDQFLQLLNYFSNDDCILFTYIADHSKKLIVTTELSESSKLEQFKNNYSIYLHKSLRRFIYIFKFSDGRIITYDVHDFDGNKLFKTFHDDCIESVTCLIPSNLN